MKLTVVYRTYSDSWSEDKKQKVDFSDDVIEDLRSWTNPDEAIEFLKEQLKELFSDKLDMREHNLQIREVYNLNLD